MHVHVHEDDDDDDDEEEEEDEDEDEEEEVVVVVMVVVVVVVMVVVVVNSSCSMRPESSHPQVKVMFHGHSWGFNNLCDIIPCESTRLTAPNRLGFQIWITSCITRAAQPRWRRSQYDCATVHGKKQLWAGERHFSQQSGLIPIPFAQQQSHAFQLDRKAIVYNLNNHQPHLMKSCHVPYIMKQPWENGLPPTRPCAFLYCTSRSQ